MRNGRREFDWKLAGLPFLGGIGTIVITGYARAMFASEVAPLHWIVLVHAAYIAQLIWRLLFSQARFPATLPPAGELAVFALFSAAVVLSSVESPEHLPFPIFHMLLWLGLSLPFGLFEVSLLRSDGPPEEGGCQ